MNRRDFLRTAGGAAGGTAAVSAGVAGPAVAAEGGGNGDNETGGGNETGDGGDGGGGGGQPDFGGWLNDVPNYDSVEDARGQGEVTVTVGADANNTNSFEPAAVHVDNGATVVWEWTGQGSHNVVDEDGEFESELTGTEGFTFEQTFDEDGIYNYFCDPHRSVGMKGSVVVGTDYPTVDVGAGGGPQALPDAALSLGVATGLVMSATLGLAYVFLKYGGTTPEDE